MKRKYRLLFVGPYPPPYSGPDVAMKTLLDSSLKNRFELVFLNTNIRKTNALRGRIDITAVVAWLKFISGLASCIVLHRPKLVYYFVTATKSGWLGRDIWCILLSKAMGPKIVIHMRAGHFERNYNSFRALERWIIRLACNTVTLGIVQAESLRNQLKGLVKDDRIVVVHNAIDTHRYTNEHLSKYDRNMILFMGHLSHAKGYTDILKIIPEIASEFPSVGFVFAGTRMNRERNIFFNQITGEKLRFENPDSCYRRYIKNGYEKNYRYAGVVKGDEKMALLRNCNFLVLPTYSEGFSMAVLEAMAMAKPVVCTPAGALGEIIQDGINGFLIAPGNTRDLADRIKTLLSEPELRDRMATRNHFYTRKRFDVEYIAGQLGDHFEAALRCERPV